MSHLTPYLAVRDARAAITWYTEALGARVVGDPYVMDDDRIGHAELVVGGAPLYLADEYPEFGLAGPEDGRVSVSLHVTVPDVDAAVAFYTRVFAPCGVREAMRIEHPEGSVVGLSGPDRMPRLWFGPLEDRGNRPVHLALAAPSRQAVDEVFALARAGDTEILHEPRIWPEYHPGYYGVFFRDPDGNRFRVVER